MYILENNEELTEEIKRAFQKNITYVELINDDLTISKENYLQKISYDDTKYVDEKGFIGQASSRSIEVSLINADELELENKEFKLKVGTKLNNGTVKYIDFGNFIIQEVESKDVDGGVDFTAFDYMSKFNIDYVHRLTAPYTYGQLFEDICAQANVEVGSALFRNSDKIIEENPFINGEKCRFVLQQIAKIAFSTAYIAQDNKAYIGFTVKEDADEVITTDNYFELTPNKDTIPVNIVTLRSSELTDATLSVKDEESIALYGEKELIVEEDYFSYTDEKRLELLEEAKDLFGLTYTPMQIDLEGSIYLNFNDVLEVTNLKGQVNRSYCFNTYFEFNGALYNSMQSPALTEIQATNSYTEQDIQTRRRTFAEINKANQKITLMAEDIDGVKGQVSKIEVALEGVALESQRLTDVEDKINRLEVNAEGTTNTLTTRGGNNIFYYQTESWQIADSIEQYTDTDVKQNTVSGLGYIINNGTSKQEQVVKNGFHTISFLYKKLIENANGVVRINGSEYKLDDENNTDWTEKEIPIEITTNTIEFEVVSDTDNSFIIADLMVNTGDTKMVWSQNANETITDTVTIGKGVQVNSSTSNTYTRIDADGNRVYSTLTGEVVTEMTDKGIETEEINARGQAQINMLLIQQVGKQAWISGIGG